MNMRSRSRSSKLAGYVVPGAICDCIVILTALSYCIAAASQRISMLGDSNPGRTCSGETNDITTKMSAKYVSSVLLSMVDLVIDFHSGSRLLLYLPCCLIRDVRTAAETENPTELIEIFGVPIRSISDGSGGREATILSLIT